jgi:NTP pyrophosphatase (non-canonical NTP hydrolase)
MTEYQQLNEIVDGLIKKYPESSQDIFRFLARLTEEVGELAEQVNHHYRGSVNKTAKLGDPDREAFASEVRDVLVGALAIARFAKLEPELSVAITKRHSQQGYLEDK